MASLILNALADSGMVTLGNIGNGVSRGSFVKRVTHGVHNGYESVLVLTAGTPADIIDLARANETDSVRVMVDSETVAKGDRKGSARNAEDLLAAFERYNRKAADDSNALAPVAYGDENEAVIIDGALFGFTVRAA
jgi:hypothetical protein